MKFVAFCALFYLQTIFAFPANDKFIVKEVRQNEDVEPMVEISVEIDGINYFFSDNNLPGILWDEADAKCRERNMTLVNFETSQEYAAVRDWLRDNQDFDTWRWTSGRLRDDVWTWMGSEVGFTDVNWDLNEPVYPEGKVPCVNYIAYDSGLQEVGWQADACSFRADYLCEEVPAVK